MILAYPIQRAVLGGSAGIQVAILSNFNPLSLNPDLWLSDTGASAGTWPDISGNGKDATQASGALQPSIVANAINGHQVRRFAGGQYMDGLFADTDSELTVFFVGTMNDTTDGYGRIVSMGAAGADDYNNNDYAAVLLRDQSNEAVTSFRSVQLAVNGVSYATPAVICVRFGASNNRIYVNGPNVAVANSFAFNISVYRIGAALTSGAVNSFWNGDAMDIIAWDRALTAAEVDQVGGYFANKAGTVWTP